MLRDSRIVDLLINLLVIIEIVFKPQVGPSLTLEEAPTPTIPRILLTGRQFGKWLFILLFNEATKGIP